MNEGFILNFTPTGMIPTREMTPHVPITPEEIVDQVLAVLPLGVTMVHLHARDRDTGRPTSAPEVYAEIIGGIREHDKDVVLCVSTSGREVSAFEQRAAVLELTGELKPDFASLTLSSLNFNQQASLNAPDTIKALARTMLERGIRPELEAFDLGMINYAKYLIRKGLLRPPCYFNCILGNIACAQADLMSLGLMVRELPAGAIWSAGGVGDAQLTMNAMALVAGGGVRVGLEDTIWYDAARTRLATNRELVERTLVMAEALGRRPYRPHEARELLGVARPVGVGSGSS
jgi:uncharacterized protein (DUF849 family)